MYLRSLSLSTTLSLACWTLSPVLFCEYVFNKGVERRMMRRAPKNLVQNGIDHCPSKHDKGVIYSRVPRLPPQVGFELLFPFFFIEGKPQVKLVPDLLDVCFLEVVQIIVWCIVHASR